MNLSEDDLWSADYCRKHATNKEIGVATDSGEEIRICLEEAYLECSSRKININKKIKLFL